MSIEIGPCPILKPTLKEFSNFHEYVQNLEQLYSKDYGMVKVVAPKGWKPRKQDYQKSIETNIIPSPIEQNLFGKGGVYECLHIIKKSMQVKEYVKKSISFDKITEGKSIEEVEQLFWKNISFSPPLYGADFQNSLFDEGVMWNMTQLDSLLRQGLGGQIAGVNSPYLYMGHWKTLFAWHTEDMDLGAINYLHYGKPKFWYCIPREYGHYVERMAKLYFADNFDKCPEYLRHKTTVINPYLLKKKFPEIKINKMIQHPREFIIVFYKSYHHGFNFGFNIAESVNFATKNWLDYFSEAKPCRCENQQVKINKEEFIRILLENNPKLQSDEQIIKFQAKLEEQKKIEQEKTQAQQSQKALQVTKKIAKNKIKQTQTKQQENKPAQKVSKVQKENVVIQQDKQQQQQKQQAQQLEMEEYIQCDGCMAWKLIKNKKNRKKLKKEKEFYCKDINEICSKERRTLRSKTNQKIV